MKERDYAGSERREFFRILYPIHARPRLIIQDASYDVLDVCERGIRFLHPTADALKSHVVVSATVTFRDGETLHVEGKILRLQGNNVVLHLQTYIPTARIMKEQRYLISRFIGFE
jgi:hypothetical protein